MRPTIKHAFAASPLLLAASVPRAQQATPSPSLFGDGCGIDHAASGVAVDTLCRPGFAKTAIIDEGILVWAQRDHPIAGGQ